MISYKEGNLITADTEALVNTVNCVGVMGKGIALQFKQAYPENFKIYEKACKLGEVRLGQMLVVTVNSNTNPRYVINFPTKQHWKAKSRLEDIKEGLSALIAEIKQRQIGSVALPALGSGNGGLDWAEVRPLIEDAFASLPEVEVIVYPPQQAPRPVEMPVGTLKEPLTRSRALLIKLIDLYRLGEYELGRLEIQKLAYFLQLAGEPLRLPYVKDQFGPYADNLNHVLRRLEGHYIRGFGDRGQQAEIQLLSGAVAEAEAVLHNDADAQEKLNRVAQLIEGYDNPYGLELLATVHWLVKCEGINADDLSAVTQGFQSWNERKRKHFKLEHIEISWKHLKKLGWLNSIN